MTAERGTGCTRPRPRRTITRGLLHKRSTIKCHQLFQGSKLLATEMDSITPLGMTVNQQQHLLQEANSEAIKRTTALKISQGSLATTCLAVGQTDTILAVAVLLLFLSKGRLLTLNGMLKKLEGA